MSWNSHHSESERFASDAEVRAKQGDRFGAIELYRLAAEAEVRALAGVDRSKTRTLGVTAVSAAALYYKAGEHEAAKKIAQQWLDDHSLPVFASEQLRNILQTIANDLGDANIVKSNANELFAISPDLSEGTNIISLSEKQDKVSSLDRFFWFCAGAQVSILSRPECTTERTKYVTFGVMTLAITMLVTLSAGYTLFLVFKSVSTAIILAMISGVLVFNINRFSYSLRKDRESVKRQLIPALARLPLVIIFSFIIAESLTLKLFEPEINGQIARVLNQTNIEVSAATARNFEEINKLEADNESLKRELKDREAKRDRLSEELMAETIGKAKAGRTGVAGQGSVYRALKSQLDQATYELYDQRVRVNRSVDANNLIINDLRKRRDGEVARLQMSSEGSSGLLARLEALSQLSEVHRPIALAPWLLVILFGSLGVLPMLMQLMSVQGPYEAVLNRMERGVLLSEQRKLFELEMQTYADLIGK